MKKRVTLFIFSFLLYLATAVFFSSSAYGQGPAVKGIFRDSPLPISLSLCGEPMPLGDQEVLERLDRELTISALNHAQVFMWIKRTGRYFPFIEQKLKDLGMPDDLKYVAVAESALVMGLRSSAGALGSWQFMPQTGSSQGLRRDRWADERLNFELATETALKYLQNLKEMFGSWALALAAYNTGEFRIKKEIEEQRVNDYYRLVLPPETERFIFRVAAIKLILENPEEYGYAVDKERIYKPVDSDAVPVSIKAPIHITDVAHALGIDFKAIKELNPQILGYHLPPGAYTLRVPAGLGVKTADALKQAVRISKKPSETSEGMYYVVQPGDSLGLISNRTGVPVDVLRKINGIQGSHITPGQKLRLTS